MASQTPNWAKLYREGRCKNIGVPWTDEDLEALKNGISVDDVRAGIIDEKSRAKVEKKMTPLDKLKRADLIEIAKEKGIAFDEDYVTKAVLIDEIKKLEQ
jgi:hypothetical protein